MIPQNMVCDQIPALDQCPLTLRRAFAEPGSYCVNITLSDDASLTLASTLVTVERGKCNTECLLKTVGDHYLGAD